MSSMVRMPLLWLVMMPALTASAPVSAQDAADWDRARASLVASQPTQMTYAIQRWQQLSGSSQLSFDDYAGFLVTYPGFPQEARLRGYAEAALARGAYDSQRVVSFFDKFPPQTNPARAQYALALSSLGRREAGDVARDAWRGGSMDPTTESTLFAMYGSRFTPDDQDARMDALLWARDANAAARQIAYVTPASRDVFNARLTALRGINPASQGLVIPAAARSDPGYLYNTARQLRSTGQAYAAVAALSERPRLSKLPLDPALWVDESLTTARMGGGRAAQKIAAGMDEAFPPNADISQMSFGLRDNYTSLMWLGGTKAYWELNEPASAAPLFYRYGAAARTAQTRSKGFYWAGLAYERAGNAVEARRHLEMAAAYPDRFYGMLALERLGRAEPKMGALPDIQPTAAERAAFYSKPLTAAVREVSRSAPWAVSIRFFREISEQARTQSDFLLVAELARSIGRRDLAVILGEEAQAKGHFNFQSIAYPTLVAPPGTDWTMVHAITRQESQFAQNAVSHAGASGLMQLMPGTAREQAGKMGMAYMQASLMNDPSYNLQLGNGYFSRMMSYYGGSYPLAVAAYNAGPGNVNKWLAANGDPRGGGIGWVEWIERIPIYETKNYVHRVLENAVMYQHLYPEKIGYGTSRNLSSFLGKRQPG